MKIRKSKIPNSLDSDPGFDAGGITDCVYILTGSHFLLVGNNTLTHLLVSSKQDNHVKLSGEEHGTSLLSYCSSASSNVKVHLINEKTNELNLSVGHREPFRTMHPQHTFLPTTFRCTETI